MLRVYHGFCGWRSGNAGDMITAPLVRALGKVEVRVMAEPEAVDLFGSGSLLDGTHPNVVPPGSPALIWGTGMLDEWARRTDPLRYLALRGPLSWARCGHPEGAAFGDPGLLVSRVWPAVKRKRYRLGIVPHYVDAQAELVTMLARRHPEEVTVVDICTPVADVLRAISECEAILSSSLHGLVFADSYSIPRAWVRLSDKLAGTPGFKFRDYEAALGRCDALPADFTGSETLAGLGAQCEAADRGLVATLGDGLVEALERGLEEWRARQDAAVEEEQATGDDPVVEPEP